MIEGGHPLSRHAPRRREQERRAADPRRVPPHRRAGDADERAAHPRRRHDARAARRPRRRRGVDRRERGARPRAGRRTRDRRGAREQDPRVVPARRAAARAPRPRERAAARRRRDRPPPARPAHPRVRRARRAARVDGRYELRGAAARRAHPPRRGVGDGDRERGHGRGARAGRDDDLATPRASRTCRTSAASSSRSARRSRASARTCCTSTASSGCSAASHAIGPEHIEVGSFIGMAAVTGGDLTIEGIVPDDLWPVLPALRRLGVEVELGDDWVRVPPDQQLVDRRRPRRRDPEDRGRPVAGVPGRPHVDRRHRRHAGAGHGADLREDVREPPVLRRQARLDGRADHPLRPASRGRHRAGAALRPAHVEPRHPRRHGDGDRGALRRGHVDRSATRTRSTRATSASTSACARSARASSASRASASCAAAHAARRRERAFVTAAPTSSVPKPSSVDQTPCPEAVLVRIDATDDAVSSGFAAQTSAAAPATSGAEYEVPDP